MELSILRVSLICSLLLPGCSTTGNGPWGLGDILSPGWQRIGVAANNAARDPHTWVPLAGAALFGIEDFDQQTTEWAARHTPIFGDVEDAKDFSDTLQDLSKVNYLVSALAVPTGSGPEGASIKARGLLLGAAAIGISDGVTNISKDVTDRQRPDRHIRDYDDNSFPSLHMSSSAISARLSSRNIDRLGISSGQKRLWKFGAFTTAGLTGWARIEGGRHYPSDVLAGYALGNFLGAFLNDAFIGPSYEDSIEISTIVNSPAGSWITFSFRL